MRLLRDETPKDRMRASLDSHLRNVGMTGRDIASIPESILSKSKGKFFNKGRAKPVKFH